MSEKQAIDWVVLVRRKMADGRTINDSDVRHLLKEIDVLRNSSAPSGCWLPMETAPKDGTIIDLWLDNEREANCFWSPTCWRTEEVGHWRQQYAEARGSSFSLDLDSEPTHWMPLPEAPNAE